MPDWFKRSCRWILELGAKTLVSIALPAAGSFIVTFFSAWGAEPLYKVLVYSSLAFVASAITLLIIVGGSVWAYGQYYPTKHKDGRTFWQVFNKHRKDREAFWSYFDEKYVDYRQENDGIPGTLNELVDQARIPDMPMDARITTWILSNKSWWEKPAQQLFIFASSFYPENSSSPVDDQAHELRALQAKFWNCWALNSGRNTS